MEAIITIVGFLGAGKTTLLKQLVHSFIKNKWHPFVILNDYENAYLDAQQFKNQIENEYLKPLNGSCLCCNGINELREFVNSIPKRENGVTLIEANGTSDACNLMSFLGVGLNDWFLPPVQISVVDVKNWQKRGEYNNLEANQIQVSSLIILTHTESETKERVTEVREAICRVNPNAEIIKPEEINAKLLPKLLPSNNTSENLDHLKSHWSSCSIDLPKFPNKSSIEFLCQLIPKEILRIKGCTQIGNEKSFIYFERLPDGSFTIKPFNGIPITGPKLIAIGPGSKPEVLITCLEASLLDRKT